jgi:4-aminobutyrate aminotransferase-like enzyme
MNYTTTATVRAMEWITALVPDLPHLYLTSSRDEAIDKALRLIKCTRKPARIAIGLAGGYLGHTVAVARSLSDPEVHRGGPGHFDWPRVPHPAAAGVDVTIAAIRALVGAVGGPDQVLGFVYELVQERTGAVIPDAFWPSLAALRAELGIPLIAVETTTSTYRSGRGPFAYASTGVLPDVMLWWGGGQTGYVHCTTPWFVPGPLTLVSTWDGDELSLVRQHHQLRAARQLDIAAASAALDDALAVAAERGLRSAGLGLYRVLSAGDRADMVFAHLRDRGLRLRRLPAGRLALIPALDDAVAAARVLRDSLP